MRSWSKRRDGADPRFAHAPLAYHTVEQRVGERADRHSLMVRHEGVHDRSCAVAGLPLRREVDRFGEPHLAARAQALQFAQICSGGVRIEHRRQRSCVRSNNELVEGRAPQREARHSLWRVLVCQRVIAGGVGRLRNAPRHFARTRVFDLLVNGRARGAAERAAARFVEHQRRHEIFEHRAGPRAHSGVASHRIERPAKRGPVAERHVAFGDCPKAREARLGREQIVEALVELMLVHAQADVKQAPARVEQESELRFHREAMAVGREVASGDLVRTRPCFRRRSRHTRRRGRGGGRRGCRCRPSKRRRVAASRASTCRTSSGSGRGGGEAAPASRSVRSQRSSSCAVSIHPNRRAHASASRYKPDVGRRGAVRHHHVRCDLHVVGR